MGILLSFSPFILFTSIERLMGVTAGLASATIVSAALLARNLISRKKAPKLLEVGAFVLFGVLTASACLSKAPLPLAGVRLSVDGGLLLVVLVSIAVRQPFTLQYAREQVAPDLWDEPEFVRANYIITAVWAFAFAIMAGADLMMLCVPRLPSSIGIAVTVATIVGATRFTSWYPKRGAPK